VYIGEQFTGDAAHDAGKLAAIDKALVLLKGCMK